MFAARGGFNNASEGTITVTGGTVTTSGLYTIRTFTASSSNLVITGGNLNIDYLLIAGGGGRFVQGAYQGGGGAGGVLQGSNVSIAAGTYPVVIGSGGNTGYVDPSMISATNGGNSTFNGLTAVGGGAGGLSNIRAAGNGGSGGGGGTTGGSGTAGPPRQGYNGGSGNPSAQIGPGGGGGAGGAGASGGNDGVGGAGGIGIQSSITGTATYYAGGGAGGDAANGAGADNYGGGRGTDNGAAHPGVLIIRYLTAGTA